MSASFQVIYLKSFKDKTQEYYRRFRDLGREASFVEAAALIDLSLRTDPRGFGDPWYFSPSLQLDVYVRAVGPVVVNYGVHRTQNLVFVNRLYVLES